MRRRDFFGRAVLGLMTEKSIRNFLGAAIKDLAQSQRIVHRTLGRTGLRIPIVSFGVMNTENPDLIRKALDLGIRHFDTAYVYKDGNSERAIGKILQSSRMRDQAYVATKTSFARDSTGETFSENGDGKYPGATEKNFFKQLETSLKRLRSDYVDILYIHGCATSQMVKYEPLLQALTKAKKSGQARYLGISTHRNEPQVIGAAVETGIYDVALTAYNFLQKHREDVKKAIKYAAEKGLGIIAMKTQAGRRVQESGGVEVDHQAALKWVLNDDNVCTAIPGMTTFEQLESNFRVMGDLDLSESEKGQLRVLSSLKGTLYCQGCGFCLSTCPQKVRISDLMRAYMYLQGYENAYQARMTLVELSENGGLNVCRNCARCQANCLNGIDISFRLKRLIEEKIYEI